MAGAWRHPGPYAMFGVLVLSVVAQGALLGRLRFFGAHADLLLTVVVCWSLLSGVTGGLLWAFFAGVAVDLLSGSPLGGSSLALMPIAYLGGFGRTSIDAQHGLFPLLLVLLATPLHGLSVLTLQQIGGTPVDWLGTLTRVILPAMVLNGLLVLPVMPGLRWLASHLEPARAG